MQRFFSFNGGLMRKADLETYQTTRGAPLFGELSGVDIASNHPPGGGVMLLQMLNILENFD